VRIGVVNASNVGRKLSHAWLVNGRGAERVTEAVRRVREESGSDAVTGAAGDLATQEGTAAVLAAVPTADILVNNLGIFGFADPLEIDDAGWRRYFEVDVLSTVRLARAYLPGMLGTRLQHLQRRGRSPLGIRPTAGSGWAEQRRPDRLPATYHRTTECGTSTAVTRWATTACGA
jgi:NAD(P)-dependent dehydrogenase (short-subunit alcohol dehydrogenase family)